MEDRRADDRVDGAYILAILYTLGYLAMMGAMMFVKIPTENREILLTLAGIMSAAQLGIIKYYYDGSKGAEKAQLANVARAAKSDNTIQEIAKAAPAAALAVAATAQTAPLPTPTIDPPKPEEVPAAPPQGATP